MREATLALAGRLNVRSQDAEVVASAISTLVAPTRVERVTPSSVVNYFGDFVGWNGFALGQARTASGLALETLRHDERMLCGMTMAGALTYSGSTRSMTARQGEALIADSSVVTRSVFSENHAQYFLTAPMKDVERHSEQRGRRVTRSVAGNVVHLRSGHIAHTALAGFAPLLSDLLADRDVLQMSPIKMRRCRDAFLEVIEAVLHDEGSVWDGGLSGMGSARHVTAAEDFMRAHAREPIGVADVAAALGISARALQLAFRRHAGTTPLSRLQRIRIEGLQAELLAGGIADWKLVAAGWGFVSAHRLARQYLAAFGETPLQTLARARD